MLTKARRRAAIAVVTAFLTALLGVQSIVAPDVGATHGRALQLSWTRTAPDTVDFRFTASFRTSYYGNLKVGDNVNLGSLRFGDGSSGSLNATVLQVDTVNDWFIGSADVSHTYTGSGPYTAEFSDCCRLSPPLHVNNPDVDYIVRSLVDLSQPSSPISSMAPIVDCAPDTVCSFSIPAVNPAGGAMHYRFASLNESGINVHPTGATVDPDTGVFTWDTTGVSVNPPPTDTLYSTQVIVEGVDSNGDVLTSIGVDFFIRIATGSTNQAPTFDAPTPTDGSKITGEVGSPITFDVQASDPDAGDVVTPGVIGLPTGATFTATPGNPATATFEWTPTAEGSWIINLTAQDQNGLGALVRSLTLEVGEATGVANTPPVAVDDELSVEAYSSGTVDVLANDSDADGDELSVIDFSQGAHGSVNCTSDGQCTYSAGYAFTGDDSFTYTISDGNGGTATAAVAVTVTDPTPTDPEPPTCTDSVSVRITGAVKGSYEGCISSGGITVKADKHGAKSVVGTVEVPSLGGGSGTATITVNMSRVLFLPIYVGQVKVADPTAGINLKSSIVLSKVTRSANTTTLKVGGLTGSLFHLRPYVMDMSITTNAS